MVLQRACLIALPFSIGASAQSSQPSKQEPAAPEKRAVAPEHSREFWQGVISHDFAPPDGVSIADLSSDCVDRKGESR